MSVNYAEYEIIIATESPFRVGRKRDPLTSVEQPITMIGNRVAIPGTTLKGALREAMERYLIENCSDKPGMKPCLPATPQTVTEDEKELIKTGKYKGTSCHYPCRYDQKNKKCEEELITQEEKERGLHYICPACYLLGAQGLVGFITVPFLYTDVSPDELPALRIDRITGTTVVTGARGAYRTYQIVPEDTQFRGILRVLLEDRIKGWKLGEPRPLKGPTLGDLWLNNQEWKNNQSKIIEELILKRLESIKRLGGFKSQGAGYVKIEIRELRRKEIQRQSSSTS